MWADMETALQRAGQEHVLTPPPPPELRDAFLKQLQALDLDDLPRMLATSLKGAEARTVKRTPFPDVVVQSELPDAEVARLRARGGRAMGSS